MRNKESSEMYLEAILKLEKINGIIRSVDIAKEMDYSKPSINKAMGVLEKQGYIIKPPYGDIVLTDKGRSKAETIAKRHDLITEFLIETLAIPPDIAETDACRIEHIISEETSQAIKQYLEKTK